MPSLILISISPTFPLFLSHLPRYLSHLPHYLSPHLALSLSPPLPSISAESKEGEKGGQKEYRYQFKMDFPKFDPKKIDDRWGTLASLALALAAGYMLTRPKENVRHVSWQEFKVGYLEKGDVERLEVINGNVVRAYLYREGGPNVGVSYVTRM